MDLVGAPAVIAEGLEMLRPGGLIPGPAVIVEDETSTVVSQLFDARVNAFGYIEMTRRKS